MSAAIAGALKAAKAQQAPNSFFISNSNAYATPHLRSG